MKELDGRSVAEQFTAMASIALATKREPDGTLEAIHQALIQQVAQLCQALRPGSEAALQVEQEATQAFDAIFAGAAQLRRLEAEEGE